MDCEGCGKIDIVNTGFSFKKVTGVAPCEEKDDEGVVYKTLRPVFSSVVNLCFSCYNMAVHKYVAETRSK